ncbi:MAG: 3D domain-containing protein [Proteobacteria bacterium]|nr:3D domain-containing protein [Pseudomonadota bacterium]
MQSITIYIQRAGQLGVVLLFIVFLPCCAHVQKRTMETTAYCGCSQCCSWERGNWKYLKLDFWHRYYDAGPDKGKRYQGHTASGKEPREPSPGLVSMDSVTHPWMIPVRIIFFPWLLLPRDGTIAADTQYYPFGTVMYVPGYGRGIVEDRGSAIKGSQRIDLYFTSHGKARTWGRQKLPVKIEK